MDTDSFGAARFGAGDLRALYELNVCRLSQEGRCQHAEAIHRAATGRLTEAHLCNSLGRHKPVTAALTAAALTAAAQAVIALAATALATYRHPNPRRLVATTAAALVAVLLPLVQLPP